MCTLSFLPTAGGFHLLMNRDEQRLRPKGRPPAIHHCKSRKAIYPSEPTGGTWIGSNDAGLTFALINWYSKTQLLTQPEFSRGQIIPRLLTLSALDDAKEILRTLPHARINPYRLIGVSLAERRIQEWRSCLNATELLSCVWGKRHWYSSGFQEAETSEIRAITCRAACVDNGDDTLESLREIHSSHLPARGPYSICMHREDACTVSFTELSLTHATATMQYHAGAPCEKNEKIPLSGLSLPLCL